MPPEVLEWGPAHLRDESADLSVEPDGTPDDN